MTEYSSPAEGAFVGPPGLNWRGPWSALADYDTPDVVRYGGSLWFARGPNRGVAPVEGANWTLFLQPLVGSGGSAGGGGSAGVLQVRDEGAILEPRGVMNFVGDGVTVAVAADDYAVTVPGAGGEPTGYVRARCATTGPISEVFDPAYVWSPHIPDPDGLTPGSPPPSLTDGVQVVPGDAVLVKNQGEAPALRRRDNGVYVVTESGPWTRHPLASAAAQLEAGLVVYVQQGAFGKQTEWAQTHVPLDPTTKERLPFVVGTSPLVFEKTYPESIAPSGGGTVAATNDVVPLVVSPFVVAGGTTPTVTVSAADTWTLMPVPVIAVPILGAPPEGYRWRVLAAVNVGLSADLGAETRLDLTMTLGADARPPNAAGVPSLYFNRTIIQNKAVVVSLDVPDPGVTHLVRMWIRTTDASAANPQTFTLHRRAAVTQAEVVKGLGTPTVPPPDPDNPPPDPTEPPDPGSLTKPGEPTKPTAPANLINDRIATAAAGDTVLVPGGRVYREEVLPDRSITLSFGPGAEIRGSDVWNGAGGVGRQGTGANNTWASLPGGIPRWRSSNSIPPLMTEDRWQYEPITQLAASAGQGSRALSVAGTAGLSVGQHVLVGDNKADANPEEVVITGIAADTGTLTLRDGPNSAHAASEEVYFADAAWPESVYVNGVFLTQVGEDPQPGQFAIDGQRRVILADDPAGKLVEVTVRNHLVSGRSAGVTIDGMQGRHAGNVGITNNDRANWTVKNADVSYCHTVCVTLDMSSGLAITDSHVHHGGLANITSSNATIEVRRNRVHRANTDARFLAEWAGGGIKLASSPLFVIDANECYRNNDKGIWIDATSTTQRGFIINNRVHHNDEQGIRCEVAHDVTVEGNVVWENGWATRRRFAGAAITVAGSHNMAVRDNVIAWNALNGVAVRQQYRSNNRLSDKPWDRTYNVKVSNNKFLFVDYPTEDDRIALGFFETGETLPAGTPTLHEDTPRNEGVGNFYWWEKPDGTVSGENAGTQARYKWIGTYRTIAQFVNSGRETGRLMDRIERDQFLVNAGLVTAGGAPLGSENH